MTTARPLSAYIERLFRDYADAFSRFDADAVSGHWAFPAYFCARGQRAALGEDEFRANAASLCDFYRARGVASIVAEVIDVQPLLKSVALVTTHYRLDDAAGALIAEWDHVYLLSATASGLRLVVGLPDEELDVWAARGTPLGTW